MFIVVVKIYWYRPEFHYQLMSTKSVNSFDMTLFVWAAWQSNTGSTNDIHWGRDQI